VRLEDLLLRHGAITEEKLQHAKDEQKKWGGSLGRIFVDLGYITEDLLLRATAHQMSAKFVDPSKDPIDPDVVRALGLQVCEQFGVIAVAGDLKKKVLRVASADPENKEALAQLMKLTGMTIELAVATSTSIHAAIRRYYYGEGPRPSSAAVLPPGSLPPPPPAAALTATTVTDVPAPVTSPSPTVPGMPAATMAEVEALERRVAQLEQFLGSMRKDLSKSISTDPQIAGMAARLEALEQLSASDVGSLRAVVELLLERGVFTLQDLKGKVKAVRDRGGTGPT
jgi:hypothetical protein